MRPTEKRIPTKLSLIIISLGAVVFSGCSAGFIIRSAYEQTKSEYENLWQNSSPVTKKKQKTFPEVSTRQQCDKEAKIPML